jgi:peptidoglycan/xylan/chitin deacetylase (PgdA/CDA1 family)
MTKVIMYHYIRNYSKKFPYYNFLHKKDFQKQIAFFEKKFYFKNQYDLDNKDNILLTFDDGLKDHIWVAKYLFKKKIKAIFFLSCYPYIEKDFLSVHKVHLILGKYKAKTIILKLKKFGISTNIKEVKNKNKIKKYQYKQAKNKDEIEKIKIKEILNFYILNSEKVIGKLFDSFFSKKKQKEILKTFYLSEKDIKQMDKMGMKICSHSYSHKLLTNLDYKDQYQDIKKTRFFLKSIGILDEYFCYPYGGEDSYNFNTLKILKKLKYKKAFSVKNKNYNYNIHPLEIPRFNCNYFKYGKIYRSKKA